MITVATNDVIINLNGHRVNGNSISGSSGLIGISGVANVVVKNGITANTAGNDYLISGADQVTLEDLTLMGSTILADRILVNSSANVTLQTIEIEAGFGSGVAVVNMSQNTLLNNVTVTGDDAVPALIRTDNTNGTIMENVWCSGITTGTTVGIQSTDDTNFSIKNSLCELVQTGYALISTNDFELNSNLIRSIVAGGLGGISITGPSSQNGFVRECTISGSNTVAYTVSDGVSNLLFSDCFAINANGGFRSDTVQNVSWENCIVEKSLAFGFSSANGQQLTFTGCRANKCSADGYLLTTTIASDIVECSAQAVGSGISLMGSTTITMSGCQITQSTTTGVQLNGSPNCVIEDMIVNGATTLGYFLANGSNSVTVENCRSLNSLLGFSADSSDNVIFKNCMADTTTIGAGFSVTNSTEAVYDQSIALNCATNGFEGITATDLLYTNCSASNATNGFFINATNRVLYCECAAQSNTVGQLISSNCLNTIVRECCIGNNFTADISDLSSVADILCLDDLICAIGPIVPLKQIDFDNGPIILSAANHYKVCANITASTTLTIAASDILLDLGEFFLDGVSINIGDGVNNVTIRNGQIRDVPYFIDIGTNVTNIVLDNLVLDGITPSVSQFGIRIASGPANGITISNITFYNSAPSSIILNGVSVVNVTLENIAHFSCNQALTATYGTDAAINIFDCNVLFLKDIFITDSRQGIDAVFMTQSTNIVLNGVDITTSQTLTNTPAGIRIDSCDDIDVVSCSVDSPGFAYGYLVQNNTTQTGALRYTDCSALGTSMGGFLISTNADPFGNTNISLSGCLSSGTSNGNGISVAQTQNLVISDCRANSNFGDGIATNSVNDCIMENLTVMANCQNGIDAIDTNQISVGNVVCTQNAHVGFLGNVVNNLSMSEVTSEHNGQEGFYIRGANNGNIPGDPANTTGQSVAIFDACEAFDNGSSGFYCTNVGGVTVQNCVTNYNFSYGLHLDTGSWNVFVNNCTALSNGNIGFLTWDIPFIEGSAYNNRFSNCFASRNNNQNVYVTVAGSSDYSAVNAPGSPMIAPIGSVYASSVLMAPHTGDVVAPVFNGFD